MMHKKTHHNVYYIFELGVLLSGFFVVYLLSYNFTLQSIVLGIVLMSYAFLGILHHGLHHTLRAAIVIEYLLVSTLIFACFLFLNTGKI